MHTARTSNTPLPDEAAESSCRYEAVKAWATLAIATVIVVLCMAALALPFALYGGDMPSSGKEEAYAASLPACRSVNA